VAAALRDAIADVRGWPVRKRVVVATATLAGVGCAVELSVRPALGLLGLVTLATVGAAVDARRPRGRVPLLRSENAAHVLAGWALVGGLWTGSALLVLLTEGPFSPAGGLVSSRSSPPAQAATAAATPTPADTPIPAVQSPATTPTPTPPPTPRSTPTPSSPQLTFLNAPLSTHRGRSVTLRARTTPRTACSIDVGYTSAPELDLATSDAGGRVSWTWRVGGTAPSGTWPVTVSCGGTRATTQVIVS
jgi:hypothetical protein